MSKNIAPDIACAGQSNSTTTSFTVELFEYGGTLRARWNSDTEIEPDWAELYLYLGDEVHRKHKTGIGKGEHDFGVNPGRGFRLALMANDFSGKPVEVVSTGSTDDQGATSGPVTKRYVFTVSLYNSNSRAELKWESDAPFRPRGAEYKLLVEGQAQAGKIEQVNGTKRFDNVRWGVGLAAAYTAESYGHHPPRIELVRTPETQR